MRAMISSRKLDLTFDPEALRADLDQVAPDAWVTHFNDGDFEGRWVGVALRAAVGGGNPLYPDPSPAATFRDTPLLDALPAFRRVLDTFRCPVRSARLLSLGPGSRIREHRDPGLGLEDGEARIHVPVRTNPDVEFMLDNRRVVMREGEAWYLNLAQAHRVANRGATDRVHLVIDCTVNDWLLARFPDEGEDERDAPPDVPVKATGPGALDAFRALVLDDPALQQRLFESCDPEAFARFVARTGLECGYRFGVEDVSRAIQAGRRAWIERNFP